MSRMVSMILVSSLLWRLLLVLDLPLKCQTFSVHPMRNHLHREAMNSLGNHQHDFITGYRTTTATWRRQPFSFQLCSTAEDDDDDDTTTWEDLVAVMEAEYESMDLSKIQLQSTDKGFRGLVATCDLVQSELVLSLPFEAGIVLLEDEDIATTTLGDQALAFLKWRQSVLEDGNDDEDSVQGLYLYLLPTPDDPENFTPTPDLWPQAQVEQLELPEIVQEVMDRQAELQTFMDEDASDFTRDEILWAHWIMTSRSFSILKEEADDGGGDDEQEDEENSDGQEDEPVQTVLLPVLDMINHSSNWPNVALVWDANEEAFHLIATASISEGQELFLSYGTTEDESMDLLLDYGFVPETNEYDLEAFEDDQFDDWSTTLEEDIQALGQNEIDDLDMVKITILRFRIKIKQALQGRDLITA